ncbi:MAG: rRNA pseudouridine synthase [Negativicutes bacterium]|nr:rRNA pseudouridine synthase [Negativicutes bacterium]
MLERLQKVISHAGVASRRHAEALILEGRVAVNGQIVKELGAKVDTNDLVTVNGKPLPRNKRVYILLNKPKGYVTTVSDPQGRKTVTELVNDVPERLYPVGRLDYNTEGLLLMTNDGELTFGLTHPSRHILKTYIAKVKGQPGTSALTQLRKGVKLADGMTAPAQVKVLEYDAERDVTALEIVIHEGKNRQVRRMCEAVGHPVKQLKRSRFAFLDLTGVRRGQYRHLTASEVARLKELIKR